MRQGTHVTGDMGGAWGLTEVHEAVHEEMKCAQGCMGVHGGAWGTIVNNFDYEPHLQSLHRLLLTLRCAKVKINVHLEQGYQERVQCKEATWIF